MRQSGSSNKDEGVRVTRDLCVPMILCAYVVIYAKQVSSVSFKVVIYHIGT